MKTHSKITLKLVASVILTMVSCYSFGQEKKQVITEANLSISMPNDKWVLSEVKNGKNAHYVFKRESIIDENGLETIPVISVFVGNAGSYANNVENLAIDKQLVITESGVRVDSILVKEGNKNYPLSVDKSMFYKCHYTSDSQEHSYYMIFIISKNKKAIQIYMDMAQSVAGTCKKEFDAVIHSIGEALLD